MPEPTGLSCIMDQRRDFNAWLRGFTAIALGLTVPAMASGRAVLQGLAAAALFAILILAARKPEIFSRAAEAVRTRLGLIVLVAFAGMAVSIPGSLDPLRSLDAWARTLAYMGGCVLFWSFLASDERARRICHRVLVLGCLSGLVVVIVAQLGWELPYRMLRNDFFPTNSYWPFHSAKAYAALMAACLPVIVWIACNEAGALRWAAWATAIAQAGLVITTVNKSALAGLLALILVTVLAMAWRRGRTWFLGGLFGGSIVIAAVLTLVYELPDEPASTPVWDWMPVQLLDTHRQQIWNFTAGKIAENPWTGHGINVIDRVQGASETLSGYRAEALPSHPHNWVLEVLGETGMIGFLPVVIAIFWAATRSLCRYLRSGDHSALTWLGLTAGFWGASLFNFSIWSSWWLIGYFLLMAIVAAGWPRAASDAATQTINRD